MPSSIQFTSTVTTKSTKTSIYTRPAKKQKMSITQTYFLAHSARGKLSKEASRADHDLRLLVGHANMLDHLMIDLANAEQEQERWFNKSVSGASEAEEPAQNTETIVEEPEADWEAEDAETSDDDSTYDEEETSAVITSTEVDSDMEEDDEQDSELTLTRTPSRHSPPELSHDSDSDSEDEHMPSSPPQPTIAAFSEKQRQAIATTSFYDNNDATLSEQEQQAFVQEGYYLPSRDQPTLVAAY
jgi:hypothetical protein